ncbi:MAG: hypothetical protein Q7U71_06000 [bacterium]|nr:hypothetical protein [bacterium]
MYFLFYNNSSNLWGDFFINIAANVAYTFAIFFIAWLVIVNERVKLLKYFGIEKQKKLTIYLSDIHVIPGGSIGIDGKPRNYKGHTFAFAETKVALMLKDIFNYILPSVSERPSILSKLFVSDVTIHIDLVNPAIPDDVLFQESFIAVGSAAYNRAAGLLEQHSQINFVNDYLTVSYDGSAYTGQYGFIEKILINNKTYFYIAGVSELATIGATHYLKENWHKLRSVFKGAFTIILLFPDERNYKRSQLIIQREN